jgi:hypothetical protein
MQEEVTGDALLARDLEYVRSTTVRTYYAYPSKRLPRFLVPAGDTVGLRFALRLLCAEWGSVGRLIRATLRVPGVPLLARTLLFERITKP